MQYKKQHQHDAELLQQMWASKEGHETVPHGESKASNAASAGAGTQAGTKATGSHPGAQRCPKESQSCEQSDHSNCSRNSISAQIWLSKRC